MMNKLRSFVKQKFSKPIEEMTVEVKSTQDNNAAVKLGMAKTIFANEKEPLNFSIILGVAPCNHSCTFCPQSIVKPKKAVWMDEGTLRKVLNELPEEGVLLNVASYSETLAAPHLLSSIRLMKEIRPKLAIAMATNGSLFKENVVKGLIEAGLDYYSYSFDAPTAKNYETLIGKNDYEKVVKNLNRLIDLRNEMKSSMKIQTHIMAIDEFKDDFESFKKTWEDKVDSVTFRPVGNWGGGDWNIKERMAEQGFHIIEEPSRPRTPCNSIFTHFKLQHDGWYAPCTVAVPDDVPESDIHNVPYLGHASEMSWSEAWEKLSDMRQAHLRGDWDDYECCKNCNIWSLWPEVWEDRGPDRIEEERFFIADITYKR